jgi:hypothetical protein
MLRKKFGFGVRVWDIYLRLLLSGSQGTKKEAEFPPPLSF